ncbi:MAG: hypothetical protein V9G13_14600 [Marmoricola sp.]
MAVECFEVAREPGGQLWVGLDERSEGVGFRELVPERFLRVTVTVCGD